MMKIIAVAMLGASVVLAQEQRQVRQTSTSVNDLAARLDVLEANSATRQELADAQIGTTGAASGSAMQALGDAMRAISQARVDLDMLMRESDRAAREEMRDLVDDLTRSDNAEIAGMWDSINNIRNRTETMEPRVENAVDSLSSVNGGTAGVLRRLSQSYWSDSSIPVFRWKKWNTYANANIGWFDENQPNGFGGINPQVWSDNNGRVWDMADSLETLTRLFNEKQVAPKFGATVCASVDVHYSSTDGTLCGAMFRIKNNSTQAVVWSPDVTMSSWHDWSETASISVNGQTTWSRDCRNECRERISITIPANSQRNRISTVLFASSAGVNAGGGGNFHQRGTILMFRDNALRLPTGLEYVDDFDVASGRWKV